MRVPPNYRSPGLERFFAGAVVGIVIGFVFFILIYGLAQDKQMQKITKQQVEIEGLKHDNEILKEKGLEENKELEKQLKVQEILVTIDDGDENLPRLVTFELKRKIAQRLDSFKNKNIETVADTKDVIYGLIEGYSFQVEDKLYTFTVKNFVVSSTLDLTVQLLDAKSASTIP
ncbi:mannitol-specific phosphotransferase system IIBC component [Pullulanibacillus pueri]|uniref:Sporulation membrane protein YtrI C-terminal domain-containing protein n=1 Tax=Pullulanibacillus pueri TaxID=1437324 RepID=A0A8J3ENP5_9BACL|nr:sporulation membrane protein YtrI [Pullulanibacillus pueri]MBM7683485.1 mannitol-specific phosphotransferase system IIBC component [Pullulanibacillus pueri]GGH86726.1 hypothetical protein GCM10007096_35100 [Pullulanibacillus pueri]